MLTIALIAISAPLQGGGGALGVLAARLRDEERLNITKNIIIKQAITIQTYK